jgi:mannosyl-3-phosphoglycerate phosphatase
LLNGGEHTSRRFLLGVGVGCRYFRYNSCMIQRSPTAVVYCTVDDLISNLSRPVTGFFEFLGALHETNIPCVWVTSRNRLQLDTAIRRVGQSSPFIAEGGCGVYLPEDYFHLKPSKSTRFARFTCIPAGAMQPAASNELELLAEETHTEVVPLRSLTPRELSQNVGLPQREAELIRQRDFDEYFFFAGASDSEIAEFQAEATRRKLQVRPRGILWSLAVGANLATCVRELTGLYERSFRARPFNIALATCSEDAPTLFGICNRNIFLADRQTKDAEPAHTNGPAPLVLSLSAPDVWETALDAIQTRRT